MRLNLHQQASEKTKKKLFEAARKIFSLYGFSGASMGRIAKEAGINTSLIYHYVKNKKELWIKTKIYTIQQIDGVTKEVSLENSMNLEEFLHNFTSAIPGSHVKSKDLFRIILWQMLEPEGEKLMERGTGSREFENLLAIIEYLQRKGEIHPRSNCRFILSFMLGLSVWPFFSYFFAFQSSEMLDSEKKAFYISSFVSFLKFTLMHVPLPEGIKAYTYSK